MELKMPVIAVSGDPKSGKTTIARKFAELYRYAYFYTGGLIQEAAHALDLTKEQYYELLASDPEKEREIDHLQAKIMHRSNDIVVEGRIAPFIKTRFPKINVLVTVQREEAARRLQKEETYKDETPEELIALLKRRHEEEQKHYLHLYQIKNHLDPHHFDIHIDTTYLSKIDSLVLFIEKIREKINPVRK